MSYLHRHTRSCAQTQFQTPSIPQITTRRGLTCLEALVAMETACLVLGPRVGRRALCEWTLCSGSLWLWHHLGWKSSTWAALHEPSPAHSYRYATMTHAPFSTQWCNKYGPHSDSLCNIGQEWNTWWAWHFIQLAFVVFKKKKKKKNPALNSSWSKSLTGHSIIKLNPTHKSKSELAVLLLITTFYPTTRVSWYSVKIWLKKVTGSAAEQQYNGLFVWNKDDIVNLQTLWKLNIILSETWVSFLGFRCVNVLLILLGGVQMEEICMKTLSK